MTYYLTLFYPPTRIGKRIGQYYTAAQVSAAVVGLVSAGFQKMDGAKGLVGFQWMFLVYGVITVANGITLLWWLPDRPTPPGDPAPRRGRFSFRSRCTWIPESAPALVGRDAEVHYTDLKRVYHPTGWRVRDLVRVFLDWRLWPLLVMYFGVVGVGIGVQNYSTVIIKATDPGLSGVELSLLSAPIWIVLFPFPFSFPLLHFTSALLIIRSPLTIPDGPHRHNPNNPTKRPLPPPPSNLLLDPNPAPNPRPPLNNIRRNRIEPVAALRRAPDRRVRTGSHRAGDDDLGDGDIPAAAWRGRGSRCVGGGVGAWESGQCGYDICAVYGVEE